MRRLSIRTAQLLALGVLLGVLFISQAPKPALANVPVFTGAVSVSAAGNSTCVTTDAGGVKCWGRNCILVSCFDPPQVYGVPSPYPGGTPTDVPGLTSGVASFQLGFSHACALMTSTDVKCLGADNNGQVGRGSCCTSFSPLSDVCADGACSAHLSGVTSVSVGSSHTCAVTSGGGALCWGANGEGQLGDGTINLTRPYAVQVVGLSSGVAEVQAGQSHSCALLLSGSVKCWGENSIGQLGNGTTGANQASPVDVCADPACLTFLSDIVDISIGENGSHTCAVGTTGEVKCWGSGWGAAPTSVPGATNVASVAAGGNHTCGLTTTGGIQCWGANYVGQLGCGTYGSCPTSPANVTGLATGVERLDAGDLFGGHTCAVLSGGGVRCWGSNDDFQLGVGTEHRGASDVPVDVVEPSDTSDLDGDGCSDYRELHDTDPASGGRRNPKDFWDFYEVPTGAALTRDRVVGIADIGAVVMRFGAMGDPGGDPLSPPPAAPAYHTAYDRGGAVQYSNPWDLLPPDGTISIGDVGAIVAQFGHNCM